jgi:uncharacterized DUF497 family protein
VATVVSGDFEWDEVKAEANLSKHGVSFEEGRRGLAEVASARLERAQAPSMAAQNVRGDQP